MLSSDVIRNSRNDMKTAQQASVKKIRERPEGLHVRKEYARYILASCLLLLHCD